MSTRFTPLIPIDPSHILPARFALAIGDLNLYADDPTCGGSVEEIEEIVKGLYKTMQAPNKISPGLSLLGDPAKDDLVGRLMKDEAEVWNQLLNNKFCEMMAKAKAGDEPVTKGFKWYMIQDMFYCTNLLIYDTERANKSRNETEFRMSIKKIKSNAEYAEKIYNTCTCTEDLGIKDDVVLTAKKEPALLAYLKGGQEIASGSKTNWISALVFMVPCIQSYYRIAVNLSNTSGIPKDTLWYKFWIEPNTKYEDYFEAASYLQDSCCPKGLDGSL